MTFFKVACLSPLKATTRGSVAHCPKNDSMCSRQISGLTTISFSALRPRFNKKWRFQPTRRQKTVYG